MKIITLSKFVNDYDFDKKFSISDLVDASKAFGKLNFTIKFILSSHGSIESNIKRQCVLQAGMNHYKYNSGIYHLNGDQVDLYCNEFDLDMLAKHLKLRIFL